MPFLLPGPPFLLQQQAAAQTVPAGHKDDIVVTGRRPPTALDGVQPQETMFEDDIATFGAESIGDVIRQLREERGGQPFSVIVNGRRIGSTADIEAFPAEALSSIQLYAPGQGARFGFPPGGQVLNLALKRHFRSLALNLQGSGSTDGGAASGRGDANGLALQNENRLNGIVALDAKAGLLASERPRDPDDPRNGAGDRSLIPRTRTLNALIGGARPLGGGTVDMNMNALVSRSVSRMSDSVAQSSDLDSASLWASYNLQAGGLFGSVSANLNAGRSRVRTTGGCMVPAGSCPFQPVDSDTLGASVAMSLSGNLAKVPTGAIQFNLSLQRTASSTGVHGSTSSDGGRKSYGGTTAQAGLMIPLLRPDSGLSKLLGTAELRPALDYNGADGVGGAWGKSIEVQWTPLSGLDITVNHARRASLPSNDQLNAPATIVFGKTVYDYRVGALVPVEKIVGGAPLARQAVSETRVSANFFRPFGRSRLSFNLNYFRTATDRPPFTIVDPSLFFERAFPDRFVRDASGTLIRVDSRPFSAARRSSAALNGMVSISGRWGGTGPHRIGAINWTLSLNVQHRLQESLLLAPGVPLIDTLATPLSISTGAQGRDRWNATWRIGSERVGGSISAVYTSGLSSTVFGDPGTGMRASPLTQLQGSVFFQFRPSKAKNGTAGRSAPYRLELEIGNLLNRRPQIETFTKSAATRLSPWLLDPLGRTISLSLRVPFGR